MDIYTFNYRYLNNAWCTIISIDKSAIEKEKEKLSKNPKFTVKELNVQKNKSILYCDDTLGSPFLKFIVGEAVRVGSRHLDARCTGTRSFYTIKEHEENAIVEFEKERKGQEKAADSYYSQPWV